VDERLQALAELAVDGVNLQRGQILALGATIGQEEAARAVAAAAYRRGALFVDVAYFDPYVKRARIEHADPDTLGFVPPWYGARLEALAERGDARIALGGTVAPDALAGLDPDLVGRDHLPWLKETGQIIGERSTNWSILPVPDPQWATLVYPDLAPGDAYEHLWEAVWHILRLDEPDPAAAWQERSRELKAHAAALDERRFDAIELRGPGTELTIGLLPTSTWDGGAFTTRSGIEHLPNLPTEEVFTAPDPARAEGHVAATKPLVLSDGTIVRGLRVRFEGGRAVEVEADANAGALRSRLRLDANASRLGELALVDSRGRIGPLETVFYSTLLDENAASHIALGDGFVFGVGEEDASRVNASGIHIDFMIGSPELEVTGVTAAGERVAVLRGGDWAL
jgi:aminopeptidase